MLDLFDETYPNVIVVCTATCYAIAHNITTISRRRIQSATSSRISDEQLARIRRLCAESIGR